MVETGSIQDGILFISTFWNDKDNPFDGLHTVLIGYNVNGNKNSDQPLTVYNDNNTATQPYSYGSMQSAIEYETVNGMVQGSYTKIYEITGGN